MLPLTQSSLPAISWLVAFTCFLSFALPLVQVGIRLSYIHKSKAFNHLPGANRWPNQRVPKKESDLHGPGHLCHSPGLIPAINEEANRRVA